MIQHLRGAGNFGRISTGAQQIQGDFGDLPDLRDDAYSPVRIPSQASNQTRLRSLRRYRLSRSQVS